MKLRQTAKIKLNIPLAAVLPTIHAYTKAFNFICQVGFPIKEKNRNNLHKLTYYKVRNKFSLPSQLTISSINKAAETLKSIFVRTKYNKYSSQPNSKLCSVRLDVRCYSLLLAKQEVSILTISGRKRFPLSISDYHQKYFKDWTHTSADLCIKKNKVFLHICFEKDLTDSSTNGTLVGIDRGINNIAVSSNNKFYGGGRVKNQVNKYQRLRNKLQKKGTKSAKRHLCRLRGKEKRFRADINHQVSKSIISSLSPGDTIVLEDLTGIRNQRLRKKQRTLINNWSFYQLEQFLIYKANAKGVGVKYIDPRYTSQKCSKCECISRGNRKSQSDFCCKKCGFKLNADLNASRNITAKGRHGNICMKASGSYTLPDGAVINQPIVSTEKSGTNLRHEAKDN